MLESEALDRYYLMAGLMEPANAEDRLRAEEDRKKYGSIYIPASDVALAHPARAIRFMVEICSVGMGDAEQYLPKRLWESRYLELAGETGNILGRLIAALGSSLEVADTIFRYDAAASLNPDEKYAWGFFWDDLMQDFHDEQFPSGAFQTDLPREGS